MNESTVGDKECFLVGPPLSTGERIQDAEPRDASLADVMDIRSDCERIG